MGPLRWASTGDGEARVKPCRAFPRKTGAPNIRPDSLFPGVGTPRDPRWSPVPRAHMRQGGEPAYRAPFPLPLPRFPPRSLTIVTGAVGPGPAPARSDPVREGAAGATGCLRRWSGGGGLEGVGAS